MRLRITWRCSVWPLANPYLHAALAGGLAIQLLAVGEQEVAEELRYGQTTLQSAVLQYSLTAVAVTAAALWLPRLGAELARQTGFGEAFVGSLFGAITTSLPEIVVSVTAVRIGALDLGTSNVLGSNLFTC